MLRFLDGFDYYVTADLPLKWNQVHTNFSQPQMSSSGRFGAGTQSLSNGDGGGFVAKALDNQATFIIGLAIKITTIATASSNATGTAFLTLFDGVTAQLDLRINVSGLLVVTRNGTVLATGTSVLTNATWYFIEFKATINSSISTNDCIVRLGGVNEIVLASGTNTRGGTSNNFSNLIQFSGLSGGCLIDDVYICDSSGSANNTFLGDVRVECIRPAADGSVAFTPNTGTNHAAVAQTTEDGDTTYNASHTINDIDTFTFGSLSSNATSIFGIQTTMFSRKDDAGPRSIAAIVRHSGTDYVGSTVGLPDSYVYFSEIRETNPATSAAWATSEVNALEAGYKLVG